MQTLNQTISGSTKLIEGIEFLKNFQGELVEIDYINLDDLYPQPPQFITGLQVIISSKYITLDSTTEYIEVVRILKETIFDIEEEYENKIIIHTVKEDIIINKI